MNNEYKPLLIICWNTFYQNLLFRKLVEITTIDDTDMLIIHKNEVELATIKCFLNKYILDSAAIQFITHDYNGIWARDYCPLSIINKQGQIELVDFEYNKPKDNLFTKVLSEKFRFILKTMPLKMEGGNLILNDAGLAICTNLILEKNKLSKTQLFDILSEYLNIKKLIVLQKLENEATGHIDMLLKFVNNETILTTDLPNTLPDYKLMQKNIIKLTEELPNIKLIKIPLAPDSGSYDQLGNIFYSYTNAVVLKKTIMLPLYGEPTDDFAYAIYQKAFPNHNIKGVFSKDIIQLKGALHCLTGQILTYKNNQC